MSKSSLGGQYGLTSNFVKLSTLLGVDDATLGKIELSIDPSHAATVYIQLSDVSNPVLVAASIGYDHQFAAVTLGTVSVKGTVGDKVTIVGERITNTPDS